METINVSPSSIAQYENCPKQYEYERILKIKPTLVSANLGFGDAIAKAMEAMLKGEAAGYRVNPLPVFLWKWKQFCDSNAVDYKAGMSSKALTEIGVRLLDLFDAKWKASGFSVALDSEGEPLLERKLQANLGDGVVLSGKLDLGVLTRASEFMVLDGKTPANASSEGFTLQADQLTAYQLLVMVHSRLLGLPAVQGVGFWELIKRPVPTTNRGIGPEVHDALIVAPRTAGQLAEFVTKAKSVAGKIRNKEFPKTPRMAWNSPCNSCTFSKACSTGDMTGLVEPAQSTLAIAKAA